MSTKAFATEPVLVRVHCFSFHLKNLTRSWLPQVDVRAEEISRLVQETASAQGQVADLTMQLDTAEHRLATALERATQAEEEVRLSYLVVHCL
jgi:chromosome segregation ATPase